VNVVLVNSMRGFGGGERWLMETAEGLSRRGHDVAVVGRSGSALAAASAGAGLPTLALPMSGDADLLSIVRLAAWIRRRRADVVNVNIERAVRIGAAAAALVGRPAVVERRGLELPVEPSSLDRLVYTRFVDHVIVNADAIRRSIIDAGLVSHDRVSVVPNGIDPSRVERADGGDFRKRRELDEDGPLIVFAGRLVGDKRPLDALGVFAGVLDGRPDARLAVVGDGPMLEEMKERAKGIRGRVVFTGRVDDIGPALAAADVLLVTSRREGMPHVVLEAMAAGTPVVATAVSGIPEIIEDGVSGLLAPAGEVEALAQGVLEVLRDRDRAGALARAARRTAREHHGLERMIDAIEERFMIESRRAAGRRR